MSFSCTFNRLPARPEHLRKTLMVLADGELHSPNEIAAKSRLSQTQVLVALNKLEVDGKITVHRSAGAPKLQVRLAEG